jgi:hypothetical protein
MAKQSGSDSDDPERMIGYTEVLARFESPGITSELSLVRPEPAGFVHGGFQRATDWHLIDVATLLRLVARRRISLSRR